MDHISDLPSELAHAIFDVCSIVDWCRLAQVSKHLHGLFTSLRAWNKVNLFSRCVLILKSILILGHCKERSFLRRFCVETQSPSRRSQ